MRRVTIPAVVADKSVMITTDVIKGDIPLLLSKNAMKKARVKIDFSTDKISVLGCEQDTFITSNGHYCIDLNPRSMAQRHVDTLKEVNFTLSDVIGHPEKSKKIARKLHRQFSHASPDKASILKHLLKDAKIENKELFAAIDEIVEACDTCIKFKKTKTKPIVGFSMAREFNDVVAMDLKQYSYDKGIWLLHLVDHATRYSACVKI